MEDYGWRYYNHALIPTCAPDETPNIEFIKNTDNWKKVKDGDKALFVRWTSEYDIKKVTNFWYCIKDTKFNIDELKSKRRYEITKGNKNFDVKVINPKEYKKEIFDIQVKAFAEYQKKYRPTVTYEKVENSINNWNESIVYGAFYKETNEMCGYALLTIQKKCYNFNVLKTIPKFEKNGVNAAIVYKILDDLNEKIDEGYYICDGTRAINHETNFQDYLEKYFCFRKAFCRLNLIYKFPLNIIIKLLYPFRNFINKFDNISRIHNLVVVLKMEEIVRGRR